MQDNNQIEFIQRVRQALGKPPDGTPSSARFNIRPKDLATRLAHYADKNAERQNALLDELSSRAEAVAMQVTVVNDTLTAGEAIRELILENSPEWGNEKCAVAWDHPLINDLCLAGLLSAAGVPLTTTRLNDGQDTHVERDRLRRAVESSYIGITSADFVVAHTATIVMKSRPGQLRSVSLVPSIHVCVVTVDQVLSDLEELYTLLQWDPQQQAEGLTNCMTFISAPSKTGDIELVMVNGAHGPKEVHLIVIDGSF